MSSVTSPPALCFFNGAIYASSDETDLAAPYSWMTIRGGRVEQLGRGEPPAELAQSNGSTATDLQGRCVLPGLIDAHIHVLMTGRAANQIDVRGGRSIEQLQDMLRTGIAKLDGERAQLSAEEQAASADEWLVGMGWEQDELGRMPTKADLDAVESARPVLLWRVCSHIFVCNSRALELAGVTASTAPPAGGAIDYPRGVLKETATSLVASFLVDTPSQTKKYLRRGLQICSGYGLTAVQTNDEATWGLYKELADEAQLPLRVFLTIQHSEIGEPGRPQPREAYAGAEEGLLQSHRVKLFADGALGAQTASLSQPYVQVPHRCARMHGHSHAEKKAQVAKDAAAATAAAATADSDSDDACSSGSTTPAPANFGLLIHTTSSLCEKVARAHSLGWRLEVHVIGDRAAEEALGAFESAGLQPKDRPILTHCQVLREDLVQRMARLGAIADVQPQFQVTDSRYVQERLPESLLRWSYAWGSLLKAGVHVAGGSDAPIEEANPLWGMHAAMFRPLAQYDTTPEGRAKAAKSTEALEPFTPQQQWREGECLSLSQALHLYTTGAAYAAGREGDLGALRPGGVFAGDFVVLDRDVVRNPLELVRAQVSEVYVAGKRRK